MFFGCCALSFDPGFSWDSSKAQCLHNARRRGERSCLAPVPLWLLRLLHALQGEPARPRTHPHGRASVCVQAVLALLQPPQPPHHPPEEAHRREALRVLPLPPDVHAQEPARRALSQAPPRRQVGALKEGDSCRSRLPPELGRARWHIPLVRRPRLHLDPKGRFQCRYCTYRSDYRTNVVAHERTHTGERPFHCTLCSRSFTQKGNLHHHMQSHTKPQPHVCPVCNQSFSDEFGLNQHLQSHSQPLV